MALGTVIQSIPAPSAASMGLFWDGRSFWSTDQNTATVYHFDNTGAILGTFASPVIQPGAVAFDGAHIWLCIYNIVFVAYQMTVEGTAIRNFGILVFCRGAFWQGHTLWTTNENDGWINQYDPVSGAALRRFQMPLGARSTKDAAFDGRYFWVVSDQADRIYQIDLNGTVVRDFATPGANPSGLTWDGRTLWSTDFGTDLIYQIMVN